MGWMTTLVTGIEFNKETIEHRSQVESKLSEINNFIKDRESYVRELVSCTEPSKLFTLEDGEDPIKRLHFEVSNVLVELEDAYYDKFRYDILLSQWNKCHVFTDDGMEVARSPFGKEYNHEHSYLYGNYVKSDTTYEDTSDETEE